MSKPKIPTPDPVQAAQEPDFSALARARKKTASSAGSTLLTAPSGIDLSAGNTGAPSLLGG
jgi:hypothetical protein